MKMLSYVDDSIHYWKELVCEEALQMYYVEDNNHLREEGRERGKERGRGGRE